MLNSHKKYKRSINLLSSKINPSNTAVSLQTQIDINNNNNNNNSINDNHDDETAVNNSENDKQKKVENDNEEQKLGLCALYALLLRGLCVQCYYVSSCVCASIYVTSKHL